MNDRPTPETLAAIDATADLPIATAYLKMTNHATLMERQRDEARERLAFQEQFNREYVDLYGKLKDENAALRDALLVRISGPWCSECGKYMFGQGRHYETCQHAKTEREVMQ